jgi:hypothetical protein
MGTIRAWIIICFYLPKPVDYEETVVGWQRKWNILFKKTTNVYCTYFISETTRSRLSPVDNNTG